MLMLGAQTTLAGSATWDLNPTSDWNTAANWTPNTIPNAPADIATFGFSNTTAVSPSANTEVNRIVFTAAATNPFTIISNPTFGLTISGVGITNNSGTTQNFMTVTDASAANFRQDVTVNGSINASDISLVKSRSGSAVP